MRIILVIVLAVLYLFTLVFVESELLRLEVKKEGLKERLIELLNQRKLCEFEVTEISNLAYIEVAAKEHGFIFPQPDDIIGIIK